MRLIFLKRLLIVLNLGAFTLASCTGLRKYESNLNKQTISDNECLQPLESFAYPMEMEEDRPTPGRDLIKLPSNPWQMEAQLPESNEKIFSLQIARSTRDGIEIWISGSSAGNVAGSEHQYLVYNYNRKQWSIIPAQVEGTQMFVDHLFLDSHGVLWGQNKWNLRSQIEQPTLFSKFDQERQRFLPVDETRELPNGRITPNLVYWSKVLLDSKDIFWILNDNNFIYSYDPMRRQITRHAPLTDLFIADAKIGPDDSIYYFSRTGEEKVTQDLKLFRFFSQSDTSEQISVPLPPWPLYTNILVDDSGRLWLGSLGWMEQDQTWYQVHQPSVFITNIQWSGMEYRWKTPKILMESNDGRLWFSSDNGITWLDPRNGMWCWFTTYQSNVVEDDQAAIWIMVDGKLYRLALYN